jgi:threonine dehydrogenase-like Zn-dependent dehydrogenase
MSALITHRFGLRDIDAALDVLDASKECGKVMIEMR